MAKGILLANEKGMSLKQTTQIAMELFPKLNIKLPMAVPKPMLYIIAWFMEIGGKATGTAPLLSSTDLAMFSGLMPDFDISKSKMELGFSPKNTNQTVTDAMIYLNKNDRRFLVK